MDFQKRRENHLIGRGARPSGLGRDFLERVERISSDCEPWTLQCTGQEDPGGAGTLGPRMLSDRDKKSWNHINQVDDDYR